MGIKKMFKKREPTEEEIREDLNRIGVSIKSNKTRPEKFGAFKEYAQEKHKARPGFAPVNPYSNLNNNNSSGNPYAETADPANGNNGDYPYGTSVQSSPYGSQDVNNPYGNSEQTNGYNSYSSRNGTTSPYSLRNNGTANNNSQAYDPYRTQTARSSRERRQPRDKDSESILDLNAIPSNQMYVSRKPVRRPADDDTLDLNELPEEDDLNVELDDLPEQEQINSEDEEVEAVKQDIRFVKQESLTSTRNTLRMAHEADASGNNTLGMLGSQSERLYGAEQNLLLADTQNKIADEKVKELKRLNRSIFVPAYGNPFNKKSRLRQQEQKIKTDKAHEKYLRETNRQEMYASEQRIKQGITQNATGSELHQKYQSERDLQAAKRYQFENDSEDDEVEKELASNLDQIGLYARKLKGTATTMGQEVDSQNERLRKIEEDADRLDINVHLNNARLNNIR